jgi:pimeloyl-ACP methyl ester carboxylesterase
MEQTQAEARILNKYNLGTLLAELSVPSEGGGIVLPESPTDRLRHMANWVRKNVDMFPLHLGYFANGEDASTALEAATDRADPVRALVIRGGEPDVGLLDRIQAPTLLIAAGRDRASLAHSREALAKLNGKSSLHVIPRASRAFEEPGVLEEAAQLAALWFTQYLT